MLKNDFILVLLDLAIPDMSGVQVFDALKQEGLASQRNIIIFTASLVDQKEIQRMLDTGAKGVLHKPLALDDLEKIIQKSHRENCKKKNFKKNIYK